MDQVIQGAGAQVKFFSVPFLFLFSHNQGIGSGGRNSPVTAQRCTGNMKKINDFLKSHSNFPDQERYPSGKGQSEGGVEKIPNTDDPDPLMTAYIAPCL